MSASPPDLSFLQQLFEQETLYIVPDEALTATAVPAPTAVAAVPAAAPEPVAVVPPSAPLETAAQKEEPVVPAAPAPPAADIMWLGEAVKGTYLLFEVQEQVFQKLPQHLFLQKVLAAVGLSTQQVKFGNLSTAVVHDVKQIAEKQQARHILLFGQGLPVANLARMEFYRMYKFENSRFVLVDSLEDIEKSVELKKKLWDVLQKIFLQQN